MIRQPVTTGTRWGLGLMAVVLLMLGYTWMSHRQQQINPKDTTIPGWSKLAEGVKKTVTPHHRTGDVWLVEDAKATLWRLFLGLASGLSVAVILGLLMGCFPALDAFLGPPVAFLAKIPPTASMAVFFVLFGTKSGMFAAMIAFGIAPTLAQTVILSVRDISDELLYKASTLGASKTELVLNVVAPQIVPHVMDAIRLAIGPALVFLLAAEMVVGEPGFGYRIRLEYKKLNMNVVYPYLVLLGLLGFSMDSVMRWAQKKICPWFVRGAH